LVLNGHKSIRKLKGTHGTHCENVQSILSEGFWLKSGRRGTGAYFWCAIADEEDAIKLAKCFVKTLNKSIDNTKISVLCCDIHVNNENYFDMEECEVREMSNAYFSKSLKALGKQGVEDDKVEADRLVNAFLHEIEELKGLAIKVYHTLTDTPTRYRKYSKHKQLVQFLNLDKRSCYVVRDNACIPNKGIKEIKVA
jgi:hypothetical protein